MFEYVERRYTQLLVMKRSQYSDQLPNIPRVGSEPVSVTYSYKFRINYDLAATCR